MGIQATSFQKLHPSFEEPEFLVQYSQTSGYAGLLAGDGIRARMAEDDLLVYFKQLNLRTKMSAGQSSFDELPGVDIKANMISTATYMLRAGAQWDRHDVNAGARWGLPVPEAYRLGLRQANFQYARDIALFGAQPQYGEGFLNAPTATSINLPPDSFGNSTVQSYDNGQMAFFISNVILGIKTRTLQLGIGKRFTILGPQRTLGEFEYNVVQLTQFQRPGAGTESTAGTVKEILMKNGDTLEWAYDDTLIGAGFGGADAVLVGMPEVTMPRRMGPVNTNIFAGITPNNPLCLTQYSDKAAPTEIISPLAHGATDMVMEWRLTSGYAPRGEALTIISMPYGS